MVLPSGKFIEILNIHQWSICFPASIDVQYLCQLTKNCWNTWYIYIYMCIYIYTYIHDYICIYTVHIAMDWQNDGRWPLLASARLAGVGRRGSIGNSYTTYLVCCLYSWISWYLDFVHELHCWSLSARQRSLLSLSTMRRAKRYVQVVVPKRDTFSSRYTLWLFHIAMEHGPIYDFLIKTSIVNGNVIKHGHGKCRICRWCSP